MFSVPDALTNWGLPLVDIQSTEKQLPNRERHGEFDCFAVGGCDRDDAVSIPLVD